MPYNVRARRSEWNRMKKSGASEEIISNEVLKFMYYDLQETNASGVVTFTWEDHVGIYPIAIPVMYPTGSTPTADNMFCKIQSVTPSTIDTPGSVEVIVKWWQSAIVSGTEVLINGALPVEGVLVVCLFLFDDSILP